MASTNQWSVSGVKARAARPGRPSPGWRKLRPFSPPVTAVQVKMIT